MQFSVAMLNYQRVYFIQIFVDWLGIFILLKNHQFWDV